MRGLDEILEEAGIEPEGMIQFLEQDSILCDQMIAECETAVSSEAEAA